MEAKLAKLEEETAQAGARWSTRRDGASEWDMGDAPADPDAVAAHAGEVIDSILRDKNMTREEWKPAPGIETVVARLAAGGGKGGGRRRPRNSQ